MAEPILLENRLLASLDIIEQKKLINTLIVGWNVEAIGLYDRLISVPALGYDVRGFVRPAGLKEKSHYKHVPVVADLSNLKEQIDRYNIDEVLIVLSNQEKQYLSKIISICQKCGVNYHIVSDAYDEEYAHVIRDVIRDVWSTSEFGLRRMVDITGSVILIILLLPLFLVVAAAIKIESRGPVFYSQKRLGKNGRIFAVHKFRSMVQDAEKQSGPVWAQKKDPRVTKVGRFMRKTRIDELPQLMNILKGDMSFIGPRPERPFFVEAFKKQIPFYMNRLKVKPGVTGLAQVTVGYDETIEDVIGIVMTKKIFQQALKDDKVTVGTIMKDIFSINENIPVSKALDLFIARKEHMFLVRDNYDQTEGILTLEDCIETVLGVEIVDESDSTVDMRELAKIQMKLKRKKYNQEEA